MNQPILNHSLHGDWPLKTLGEVTRRIRNGTTTTQNQERLGVPVTRIETISGGVINLERCGFADASLDRLHDYVLRPGDILFSHINSLERIGNCAIYDGSPETLVHGMNLLRIEVSPYLVLPDYLVWYLRSNRARSFYLSTARRAIGQASINIKDISAMPIPVPTLSEQQRIVAKLDEQMAALNRAEKALAEQRTAAFALTAAVLRGILASPSSGSWPMVSLREASYIISKGTTPTSIGLAFSQSGIPFVRAEDIQGGKVDIGSIRMHIDEPASKVLARSSLQPGDLLLTIAGTLGRVGYVSDDTDELNCNQAVAFVRLKPEILDVQYACISLQNGILASHARADGAGNSIQNMSLAQVGELTLPVPPLAVQRQLVSSMRATQDRVKSTLTSIEGRFVAATALRTALLDAAFAGEI